MNALVDRKVASYVNEHCVATYMKVGTFQLVGGQKVGGNVASYFCLSDGAVLHAVPGPVPAHEFLREARWAVDTRKMALTLSTDLAKDTLDAKKYRLLVRAAHEERYQTIDPWRVRTSGPRLPGIVNLNPHREEDAARVPAEMPRHVTPQVQAHWLLARRPLDRLEQIYPVVWQDVLNERLSQLPVAIR